jgi:hypothetical protein
LGLIGDTCALDSSCTIPNCLTGVGYPGGMCSADCTSTTCPTGASCITNGATGADLCARNCSTVGSRTACRSDNNLVCDDWNGGVGTPNDVCVPICNAATMADACGADPLFRCRTDGRCCGLSLYACCDTGVACLLEDGGTSSCMVNGYCP